MCEVNLNTFNKQLCGTFLISCSYSIGCIIVHVAVVDDQNPLCAFVLKNIPKEAVYFSCHWSLLSFNILVLI